MVNNLTLGKKVFICEGHSGAGKTTLMQSFSIYCGYKLLPPIHEFLSRENIFCITSYEEIHDRQRIYIDAYINRYKLIDDCRTLYLAERDFISQVVYTMTCAKLKKWKNIAPLFQLLREQSSNLLLPISYIYVHCDMEIALARKISRGSSRMEGIPSWCTGNLISIFEKERSIIYDYIFSNINYPVFTFDSSFYGCEEGLLSALSCYVKQKLLSGSTQDIEKFITSLEDLSKSYLESKL